MLCFRCPAARGPRRGAGRGQEADGVERAHAPRRGRRDHAHRARRARVRLQRGQAHRQAPPEAEHAPHTNFPVWWPTSRASRPAAQLTGPRLVPLWLTLERNRAYWSANASGPSTRRISFPGSQLVWQWFPGQGLQFHPLANFAKLNQLWASRNDDMTPAARRAARAARPARRRHGVGVLLRLRRRQAAVGLGPRPGHGHPVDHPRGPAHGPPGRGLPDRRRGARRVRDADARGRARARPRTAPHYALYSFDPGLRVINGFMQALVGLYDLGRIGNDERARALFADGERAARRRAADVRHRRLVAVLARLGRARVRPLLPPAPARVPEEHVHPHRGSRLLRHRAALRPVRARAAAAVARHHHAARRHRGQAEAAAVEDLARRAAREARPARSSRSAPRSWSATARRSCAGRSRARRASTTCELTAVDLAGNVGTAAGTLEVLKPKKRKRSR